jgi:hypothetical protein
MRSREVEVIFVELFEFLERFHNEHTDFGELHTKIHESLWPKEAELMEFFRREFVTYHGEQVYRELPAEIIAAQSDTAIELHGKTFNRTRYSDEILWHSGLNPFCGDCSVSPGQIHLESCDIEECPRCFGQLLSCGCVWGEGPVEAHLQTREAVEARRAAQQKEHLARRAEAGLAT